MFDKLTERALEELSHALAVVAEEEPTTAINQYPHFARCLSVLMRTELAERRRRDTVT